MAACKKKNISSLKKAWIATRNIRDIFENNDTIKTI